MLTQALEGSRSYFSEIYETKPSDWGVPLLWYREGPPPPPEHLALPPHPHPPTNTPPPSRTPHPLPTPQTKHCKRSSRSHSSEMYETKPCDWGGVPLLCNREGAPPPELIALPPHPHTLPRQPPSRPPHSIPPEKKNNARGARLRASGSQSSSGGPTPSL